MSDRWVTPPLEVGRSKAVNGLAWSEASELLDSPDDFDRPVEEFLVCEADVALRGQRVHELDRRLDGQSPFQKTPLTYGVAQGREVPVALAPSSVLLE